MELSALEEAEAWHVDARLRYPERCTDIAGQVVGPNFMNEHYVITGVQGYYDADDAWVEARLALLTPARRAVLSLESRREFTQQRIEGHLRRQMLRDAGLSVNAVPEHREIDAMAQRVRLESWGEILASIAQRKARQ